MLQPWHLLDVTILVDHDIVDGALAAGFTRRLAQMIESAEGLVSGDSIYPNALKAYRIRCIRAREDEIVSTSRVVTENVGISIRQGHS
jgi:hypothetical protein